MIKNQTVLDIPVVSTARFAPFLGLVSALLSVESTIATMVALTEPKLIKPKQTRAAIGGTLLKLNRFQCIVGSSVEYGSAVNRRLRRTGELQRFQPHPRTWGERIAGTPFVYHKGELFLEVFPFKQISTTYLLFGENGLHLWTHEEAKKILAPTYGSNRQEEAGLTREPIEVLDDDGNVVGTVKQVVLNDYRVDRIRQLRAMKARINHKISVQEAIQNALRETGK